MAGQVSRERQERKLKDVLVVSHLRHAVLELHVRSVDIGQTLQRDAVVAGLAGRDHARAAQPDRHVRFHRALDEVSIRFSDRFAVRIDDLDVV